MDKLRGAFGVVSIFTLLLFTSCSGGSGGSGGGDGITVSAITAGQQEAAALNAALNGSDQYQFTKAELDLLKSQGAITQTEYDQLLVLVSN